MPEPMDSTPRQVPPARRPTRPPNRRETDSLFDDAAALFVQLYEDPHQWSKGPPVTIADRRAVARQLCVETPEDDEILSAALERCLVEMRRLAAMRTPVVLTAVVSGGSTICVRSDALAVRTALATLQETGFAELASHDPDGTVHLVRANLGWVFVREDDQTEQDNHSGSPCRNAENPQLRKEQ